MLRAMRQGLLVNLASRAAKGQAEASLNPWSPAHGTAMETVWFVNDDRFGVYHLMRTYPVA